MATLADVTFEDFLAWIGAIEGMDDEVKKDLFEAMSAVPLIERLMVVHTNAMRHKAAKRDLLRSSAIINSLVALYFILEGRTRPGSAVRKSITRRKAGPETTVDAAARPASRGE
jgi:hypothetical protein